MYRSIILTNRHSHVESIRLAGKKGEIPMNLGPTELIVILLIVIVLFGVGRISKIAGEMGSGIRSFKQGLQGDDKKEDKNNPPSDSSEGSG